MFSGFNNDLLSFYADIRFNNDKAFMDDVAAALREFGMSYLEPENKDGQAETEDGKAPGFVFAPSTADDGRAGLYCALIDAFLPVFDDYLLANGLLSL